MKKILISIRPKWVAKILNGEKTFEIRKTAPKCNFPCEVYVYCTKDKNELRLFDKEICEQFKSDRARAYSLVEQKYYTAFIDRMSVPCNGKVVAKFTLNKVEVIAKKHYELPYYIDEDRLCKRACLDYKELRRYLGGKDGYAWHIDNLVIFDKPKELSDFIDSDTPTYEQAKSFLEAAFGRPYCKETYKGSCEQLGYALRRPPQSWQYVEEI